MDKRKHDKLLEDFNIISGVEISLLDSSFHTLSVKRGSCSSLCPFIHTAKRSLAICKSSDIEHLTRACDGGESELYTCPFGLREAIVPIIRADSPAFYLISGLGIPEGREEEVVRLISEELPELDVGELRRVIADSKKTGEREALACLSMMELLAEHIAEDKTITEGGESIGKLVKQYVKNNLSEKLTLSDIAWNLHCSTVTLTEHFRREFGITIVQYITKKRMDLAEQLLLSTDSPLGEIAAIVGFTDVEYFSRTFKKHHGTAPGAWRTAHKAPTQI